MLEDKLNESLERHARDNLGTNHGPEYVLYNLPTADSLIEALELNFSQIRTSRTSPRPAEAWDIRTVFVEEPDDRLLNAAQSWFFGSQYSSDVSPSTAADEVLDFVINLRNFVGDVPMFEVKVTPPQEMWYGCCWEDFAFDGKTQRWLLHLGFSD
ncbi:MAG: hypothetical protein AAFZ17_05965 [Cyanobacteria bacterium J06650_10]